MVRYLAPQSDVQARFGGTRKSMIVSHKHKYVFIEFPNAASSAIHRELRDYCDGEPIMHPTLGRHGYYHEFLKDASFEEKSYFAFSAIRNPLDVVVSLYFKFKTNHNGIFTDPTKWKRNGGFVTDYDLGRFEFVTHTSVDFPTYFAKYYTFPPYDNWSSLSHREFDYVIRFENLQEDFAKVLGLLGIEPVRPLPMVNRTGAREEDFWSYYTPEIRAQATSAFGPYMKEWGYDFPAGWGDSPVPRSSTLLYHLLGLARRRLQWGSSLDAHLFRRLFGL